MHYGKTNISIIQKVHRLGLRVLLQLPRTDLNQQLESRSGFVNVMVKCYLHIVTVVYDIRKGEKLPAYYHDLFEFNDNSRTRLGADGVRVRSHRLKTTNYMFTSTAASLWNRLSATTRSSTSKSEFRRRAMLELSQLVDDDGRSMIPIFAS
jgi:hypothetical protein